MKHAYLIVAHNERPILERLLSLLDHPRNDIYLHIDAKAKELYEGIKGYKTQHSRLEVIDRRVDVRWGDISMVEVEYTLLESAHQNGPYAYYHLLSGVDMPIKSQEYIHRFFDENGGRAFVSFWNDEKNERDAMRRTSMYYLFTRDLHVKKKSLGYHIKSMCRNIFLALQKVTKFKRPNKGMRFKKGSNWISITEQFCRELLNTKGWVMKRFKQTLCSDEIFAQTVMWNSVHFKNIYCYEDDQKGNMRAIDWQRGSPYTWQNHDIEELLNSPMLFARKFSSTQMEVVDKLHDHLKA